MESEIVESTPELTPRERVARALAHQTPDRTPVDFLATPEIWQRLIREFGIPVSEPKDSDLIEPARNEVLRKLGVDCRVISYDMFFKPPQSFLQAGAQLDWWGSGDRSTPNRMWRQALADDTSADLWGRRTARVKNDFGGYEELVSPPLGGSLSLADVQAYPWPTPDMWDFSALPGLITAYDRETPYHLRFRVGSVFEVAWQLRGMETFMMDLVTEPAIPTTIMDRLSEVYIHNLEKVLELAGDRFDSIYFYDDVATQNSLMISKKIWRTYIKPQHQRIIDTIKKSSARVMYHCDGAVSYLLPELIDMGIDILNPIQVDATGMEPRQLKENFGSQLSFHGGIDIIQTLRTGTPAEVVNEVQERIRVLGENGGYILASSHHIQADTPVENVLAMYDLAIR